MSWLLYWRIGHDILERQRESGWGARIVDQLSKDLHRGFPDMAGFSPRNLKYMRASPRLGPTSELCNSLLHNTVGS